MATTSDQMDYEHHDLQRTFKSSYQDFSFRNDGYWSDGDRVQDSGTPEPAARRLKKGACPTTAWGKKSERARLARVTTPLPENNRSHVHLLTRRP